MDFVLGGFVYLLGLYFQLLCVHTDLCCFALVVSLMCYFALF